MAETPARATRARTPLNHPESIWRCDYPTGRHFGGEFGSRLMLRVGYPFGTPRNHGFQNFGAKIGATSSTQEDPRYCSALKFTKLHGLGMAMARKVFRSSGLWPPRAANG